MAAVGAREVTLGNGVVVCAKRSSWQKGHVAFQAFALGGSSELDEPGEAAMQLLDDVAGLSGLGPLDGDSLLNFKSTRQTRVNTQRHTYHRGLGGSAPVEQLENLLQMLHLKLCRDAQPFSQASLEKVVSVQMEGLRHREKDPHFHFMERGRLLAYGDLPIMRPTSAEVLNSLAVEDLRELYNSAFTQDPTSFRLVFVGDLPEEDTFTALIETYLGSLRCTSKDAVAPFGVAACGSPTKKLRIGSQATSAWLASSRLPTPLPAVMTPGFTLLRRGQTYDGKASNLLVWRVDMPEDAAEDEALTFDLKGACQVLESRLLAVLRTERSEIYNVDVSWTRTSLSPWGMLNVAYGCEPSRAEDVLGLVRAEIARMATDGPSAEETEAVKSIAAGKHGLAMENNSYWLFWLLDAYKAWDMHVARLQLPSNKNSEISQLSRAAWVEALVRKGSADFERYHLSRLTPGLLQATVQHAMPADRCLMLTLVPEHGPGEQSQSAL
eukprot:gnl/TRDRNA2_/TRDRNA2_126621_c0_seq1.p1 gnl/TRDRNA2_/TRDRNA2_126621_c0~~gnl/TRDRNA2_/TRDRNA2_126621_c0_seq1.p1  ORF type:complete len:559 (-),score=99.44 gnl/TRDRNA2_/TRDRNA2_126621_c0_seq1:83-1567(-)